MCYDTFDSPVPKDAPAFFRGHPLNSTSILISWKSLPPSQYKEQLIGYRIRYKRLGSKLYTVANITNNVTEAVITKLLPRTKYEFKVNGFNEIGPGPTSKIIVVGTLSFGKLIITFFKSTIVGLLRIRV